MNTPFTFTRVERRRVTTTTSVWTGKKPDPKIDSTVVTSDWYAVEGAPDSPLYGRTDRSGRLYRPTVVYVERRGTYLSATVRGRLVRKNGTLSEAENTIHGLAGGSLRDPRPAWLEEIVKASAR